MTPRALAELCAAAMPDEQLTADELAFVCFGDGAQVVGDDEGAAAYVVKQFGEYTAAWLLLVVVAPEVQHKGKGRMLVEAVAQEARAAGARSLRLANAIPRYLWPGVDLANTNAGMLFESMGFERDLLGLNMTISSSFRRPPPTGVTIAPAGTGAIAFAGSDYPHWEPELASAIERGTAFEARVGDDPDAVIGFACHSVNRRAWIGPMATKPKQQHGGIGSAVLAAICEDLDDRGVESGEICWVSNLRFYGKCGATVSRAFQGGRLDLRSPEGGASSENGGDT